MTKKELVATGTEVFDRNGNIVLEERKDGVSETQTVKYGLIRLMGEKVERRVSMKTLLEINNVKNSDFSGQINIPELSMSVNAAQIVMMRSETEEVRRENNIANLPTEVVFLDENFNQLKGTRNKIERENDCYYIATCHYVVRNDEKQYYLEPHQIQALVKMARDDDPDYPHYVSEALQYGRDVNELKEEQKGKR